MSSMHQYAVDGFNETLAAIKAADAHRTSQIAQFSLLLSRMATKMHLSDLPLPQLKPLLNRLARMAGILPTWDAIKMHCWLVVKLEYSKRAHMPHLLQGLVLHTSVIRITGLITIPD